MFRPLGEPLATRPGRRGQRAGDGARGGRRHPRILQLQSRTNTQQVNLRSGVTISEESAIIQVAARAKQAVVSVVHPGPAAPRTRLRLLVTSDGYVVTATLLSGRHDDDSACSTATQAAPGAPGRLRLPDGRLRCSRIEPRSRPLPRRAWCSWCQRSSSTVIVVAPAITVVAVTT